MVSVVLRGVLISLCLFAAPPSYSEVAHRTAYIILEPYLGANLTEETSDRFVDVLRIQHEPIAVQERRVEDDVITLVLRPRDVKSAMAILNAHEGQRGSDEFVFQSSQNTIEIRPNLSAQRQRQLIEEAEDAARIVLPEASITRRSGGQILITSSNHDPGSLRAHILQDLRLSFHLVLDLEPADSDIPAEAIAVPAYPGVGQYDEVVLREPAINGDRFVSVRARSDSRGPVVIDFQLDRQGVRELCIFTRDNLRRRFAVIFDGKVVMAPVIVSPICGGAGQIDGGFDEQEAQQLVSVIRAGLILSRSRVVETGIGAPAN